MSQFDCKCGLRLSNTNVPSEIQFWVYSDLEWEKIMKNDVIPTLDLPLPNQDVWKCPNCHRLHIFTKGGELTATYVLELPL